MRPVTRGPAPRFYTAYGQAIADLEERLGVYCSYCERRLPTSLAVEHVVPKSLEPDLETSWRTSCSAVPTAIPSNSPSPTNKDGFLWPDIDNTLDALSYASGGFVEVKAILSPGLQAQGPKAGRVGRARPS
jgi:hypothetical protein